MPDSSDRARDPADDRDAALKQIAESVREIFWVGDATGTRLLYVNPAYEAVTGRTRESLYANPRSWRDNVHPDDRARIDGMPRLSDQDLEFRIVRPNGEIRWLWSRGSVVRDEKGIVRNIVGVAEDITERKHAEQELRLSTSLLRATLEATADGILALDGDARIAVLNQRFIEMWRLSESALKRDDSAATNGLVQLMREQVRDPAAFVAHIAWVRDHPDTNSFHVIELRDGRTLETYSQPAPLADFGTGRVWSFHDTTARTRAVRALRQRTRQLEVQNELLLQLARHHIATIEDRQETFERITASAAELITTERVGIWLFDARHRLIRLAELFQRGSARHSSGTSLARDMAPSYFEAVEEERTIAVHDVHKDARTRELAEPYCEPLGITSMLDAPIRAGGKLMGVVCFEHVGPCRSWTVEEESFAGSVADLASIAIEVVDREQAESRMRFLADASDILASSLDYRTTLGNVTRLVITSVADWCFVDLLEDGHISRVASAHAKKGKERIVQEMERSYPLFGDSPQIPAIALRTGEAQLVSEMTDQLLREHSVDQRHYELARELGIRSYLAVPLKARNRTIGVLSFGTTRQEYDDGDLAFAENLANRAAIAIDNARLHAEAQQADKAKSDFLAIMSHELRTPLTAIMGYTELLLEGIRGPVSPDQKGMLDRILLRSQDLLRTLEEILAFSRTESGRERSTYVSVDVGPLVREVESIVRPLADERDLDFDVHVPDESLAFVTDPDKLKHILLNLLSNAVKFTESGSIDLDVRRERDAIVFRVSDTGQGIEPENLERIFEPFAQIESALTREKGGTGLGLAVVQRLTRLLGGDVSVRSEPGAGSTFTVRLPAVGPEPGRDSARRSVEAPPGRRAARRARP